MLAQKLNIIDVCTGNFQEEASLADLIILACPVEKAEQCLEVLSTLPLKEDVIITDVCSTKSKMMEKAEQYFTGNVTFIGGHPMRSEEHTSELQSRENLVCRLLLEKKKKQKRKNRTTKKPDQHKQKSNTKNIAKVVGTMKTKTQPTSK